MTPKRVLVVDDEPDIREVARLALEVVAGWTVQTAASGREGIAIARQERPDAILLDLMMPDMDGMATVEALRADPVTQAIPALLLTAAAEARDVRRITAPTVQGVIPKPFDPMTLAQQVAAALHWII